MTTKAVMIAGMRPTHGDISPANRTVYARGIPHLQAVMDLPAANAGIFEMTEKEIKTFRSRIYSLNKHNAVGWRWRTLVEQHHKRSRTRLLLVWRIH